MIVPWLHDLQHRPSVLFSRCRGALCPAQRSGENEATGACQENNYSPIKTWRWYEVTATTKLIRIITRIIALSPIIGAISGVINIIKWLTDD